MQAPRDQTRENVAWVTDICGHKIYYTMFSVKIKYAGSLLFLGASLLVLSCKVKVEKEKEAVAAQPAVPASDVYEYMPNVGVWNGDIFRFCCNGVVATHKQALTAGNYEVLLTSRGTMAYEVYPLIKVQWNDSLLQEVRLDSTYKTYNLPFSLAKDDSVKVQVFFNQDGLDDKNNDRDVFIKKIEILPVTK
jgi:hypothetical protein